MFSTTALSVALLAVFTAAAPAALEARQGGVYVAVGNKYSGGGCNPSQLIFADPIFGDGNVCQPLDRFGTGAPILSYQTLSTNANYNCSVVVYTGPNCSGTAFSAPIGGCVTGNSPFVSTYVTCVPK